MTTGISPRRENMTYITIPAGIGSQALTGMVGDCAAKALPAAMRTETGISSNFNLDRPLGFLAALLLRIQL